MMTISREKKVLLCILYNCSPVIFIYFPEEIRLNLLEEEVKLDIDQMR